MDPPWRRGSYWRGWMLLHLIYPSALGSLVPEGCPQLMYVAGNHDYPHVEGLYLLQDDLQRGDHQPTHPVYRHACHDNYLYYHLSHAAWWIGPELGALSGYALSYSGSGPNPSRAGEPWLYWSHLDREWYHDLGARTVCLNISCQRLTMSGHQLSNLTSGEFLLTDTIHYDRPVYTNHASGLFLYHGPFSQTCNAWMVGPQVGSEHVYIHAFDATSDPLEISANWTLSMEDSIYSHHMEVGLNALNITISCLETYKYYKARWRTSKGYPGLNNEKNSTDVPLLDTSKTIEVTERTTDQPPKTSEETEQPGSYSTVSASVGKDITGGPEELTSSTHPIPTEEEKLTMTPFVGQDATTSIGERTSSVEKDVTSPTTKAPTTYVNSLSFSSSISSSSSSSSSAGPQETGPTFLPTTQTPSSNVEAESTSFQGQTTYTDAGVTVSIQNTTLPDQKQVTRSTTEEEVNVTYTTTEEAVNISNNTTISNESDSSTPLQTNVTDLPADCGEIKVQAAISFLISGRASPFRGRWPWMVAVVKSDNTTKCGAVLVSSRYLVTAAHCVDESPARVASYRLLLGANNRDRTEPGVQTRYIQHVTLHHNFSLSNRPFRLRNDIGLIELDVPVIFTKYIQPVCLPASDNLLLPFPDVSSDVSSCHITGFGYSKVDSVGRTSSNGGILQEQSVHLETIASCARRYFSVYPWLATSDNLCVRPDRNAKVCKGDSGSPLMCRHGSRWTLVGIASWSMAACISGNFPSIYVDFREHADWIRQTINSQSAASREAPPAES